jgi:hypothetical protein
MKTTSIHIPDCWHYSFLVSGIRSPVFFPNCWLSSRDLRISVTNIKDGMGGARNMYSRHLKFIRFWSGNLKGRDHLEDLDQLCAACGPRPFPTWPLKPLVTHTINISNLQCSKTLCGTSLNHYCLRDPPLKLVAHHLAWHISEDNTTTNFKYKGWGVNSFGLLLRCCEYGNTFHTVK